MIVAFTGAGISRASGIPTFDEKPAFRSALDRTYAKTFPGSYAAVIRDLADACRRAEPNLAHIKLAEYKIPTITMNIDGLHERAILAAGGDLETLLEIHGSVFKDSVVLYGDRAPLYATANDWIRKLRKGDYLLVVGTSYYTQISALLTTLARAVGASVIDINSYAEVEVPKFLESHTKDIGSFSDFKSRELLF